LGAAGDDFVERLKPARGMPPLFTEGNPFATVGSQAGLRLPGIVEEFMS
jgi:hypothetical protein